MENRPEGTESRAVQDPAVDRPWRWPEETWRRLATQVGAGRGADVPHWPGGASVAVALSFDLDNETAPLCQNGTSPGLLAQAHYGARAGLPRILSLLREHGVRASFFVPAVSALLTPEAVGAIGADGHEVGLHGWIHERCGDLTGAEEHALAERGAEVLRRCTGLALPGHAHAVVGRHRAHRPRRPAARPAVRLVDDGRRRAVRAAGTRRADRAGRDPGLLDP
ncbi:polysaccharide deacetylase family protein [Streptomyces griseoviridis]|uniref:polysaccharide deacetylase family protein n=1 Tax=Streptomyces griseoviridis TaxID=45398 RepID=UPI0034504883